MPAQSGCPQPLLQQQQTPGLMREALRRAVTADTALHRALGPHRARDGERCLPEQSISRGSPSPAACPRRHGASSAAHTNHTYRFMPLRILLVESRRSPAGHSIKERFAQGFFSLFHVLVTLKSELRPDCCYTGRAAGTLKSSSLVS